MKDIVDENCDATEEKSTHKYLFRFFGFNGTMVGILVGIGHLWISGGLSDLLNIDSSSSGMDGMRLYLAGYFSYDFKHFRNLINNFGSLRAKCKAKLKGNMFSKLDTKTITQFEI